ncbi:hypothetical protein BDV93DRAFT_339020 [Ceratobasidium sp. AG-I]|nr:hypothetical protein BDV93DRAFT_339020 [Ceratobasidium sp. AG-I]
MVLKHCPPDSQVLSNSYPDWLKAAQLFHEPRYNYAGSKFNRDHLSTCHQEWMKLGASLFRSQMTDEPKGCLNPRCPHPIPLCGVQLSCKRCFSATYCSHGCQQVHSVRTGNSLTHVQSHSLPPLH